MSGFGIAFVPPSRFYGHRWHRYLLPCRITMAHNPPVYRWLVWNFGWTRSGGDATG